MTTNPELVEVGRTARGYTLWRQENGAGGHTYWSDAIAGGVAIWDTCLASREELEEAFRIEETFQAKNNSQHAAADVIPIAAVRTALTMSDATIRLHAGEMTAQEMRTVQAVLKWKLAELEHIAHTGTPRPADKCILSAARTND